VFKPALLVAKILHSLGGSFFRFQFLQPLHLPGIQTRESLARQERFGRSPSFFIRFGGFPGNVGLLTQVLLLLNGTVDALAGFLERSNLVERRTQGTGQHL
jgi:hypothetical protein